MADSENRTSRNSVFEHMDTEDLQELIRLDMRSSESDSLDDDYVLQILEVLAGRKKEEDNSSPSTDAAAAWDSFKENYLPYAGCEGSIYDWDDENNKSDAHSIPNQNIYITPSKTGGNPRRIRLLRFGITAAAFILLFAIFFSSTAFGGHIWLSFVQWTRETLRFSATDTQVRLSEELSSLHEALAEHGITHLLAPTWLPEGFMLSGLTIDDINTQTLFISFFQNGDASLMVQIIAFKDTLAKVYEKDDEDATPYRRNGIDHYIMANSGKTGVVWAVENYECGILGNITIDEAKNMINSIYER